MISGGLNGGSSDGLVSLAYMVNIGFSIVDIIEALQMIPSMLSLFTMGGPIGIIAGVVVAAVITTLVVFAIIDYINSISLMCRYMNGDESAGQELMLNAVINVGCAVFGAVAGKAAKAAVTKIAKNKIINELGEELAEKVLKNAEDPAGISKSIKKLNKQGVAKETIKQIAEETGEQGLKAARYGDDAIKAILKYGDDAVGLINKHGKDAAKSIANHDYAAIKLITKHGDNAAKAIANHGDKAIKLIDKYGNNAAKAIANHGDDAIKLIAKYGNNAAKTIAKYGDDAVDLINKHGKNAAKAIANHGDNAVKAILEYGDEAVGLINKHGKNAAKAIANHGNDAINLITKHGDNAAKAIANYGDDAVKAILKYGDDAVGLITEYGDIAIDCVYGSNEAAFKKSAKQIKDYPAFRDISLAIGRQTEISDADKVKKLQNLFSNSTYKTDVNVPADVKYLKTPGFNAEGWPNYDWPARLGFKKGSIKGITKEAPLPKRWDRYGNLGGANFADIPADGKKYTYSQRSIPYVPNKAAYHYGTFDNTHYFDIIDCIKNDELKRLNSISPTKVTKEDFKKLQYAYEKYCKGAAEAVKGTNIDYTYGLQGIAEEMVDMEGGATQFVTPISGEWLEKLGVLIQG